MGALGGLGLFFNQILPVQLLLYALANVALVFLGLHLAGLGNPLRWLERLGAGVWRRIQPYGANLLPADTLPKAFLMGGLWGWLPCGLVYSLLATALLSGGAASGAALMFAFGLGTLPSLLAAGMLFKRLRDFTSNTRVRFAAGALVAGFGFAGLARAANLGEYIRQGILCLT
jgi:sulfite exporter TauE/SafE